jgi:penicillin-binding protein 1A
MHQISSTLRNAYDLARERIAAVAGTLLTRADQSGTPDAQTAARPAARHGPLAKLAALVSAVFIVLSFSIGLVTWLLVGIHFPSTAEVTSRRVIVLQSADGQDLQRKGRLMLAPVAARDMPADVINAVLSIEDRHFYQHGALDARSMLRAFKDNMDAGKVVAGGSTITQQLVKTLFVGPERTYLRKIREAAIGFWIEDHLSKDQILTSYLNNVYLGSGATGFPAAAKLYFNKSAGELDLAQAAMLAGMINAPGQDDPLIDLVAARNRAAVVLDAMVANGVLSDAAAVVAKLHPATPVHLNPAAPSTGWFVDWVYNKVEAATPTTAGTIRIHTTLDLRLQQLAADIIDTTLAKSGREKHAGQAALVAMRPDGSVVAMVGGRDYDRSQYNRAVQAQRQPGSAFKLFDYYAALRKGYTPQDTISDAPVDIRGWEPENYGHRNHGRVTLADAFAQSLNDATVRLSQDVGIGQVIAAARDLGLRAPLKNNPSLALGTAEVSLLDLTSAYAAVRAGKAPVDAHGIAGIDMQSAQNMLPVGGGDAQHSLGNYQAELIDLLRGVVEHGTGRAASLSGFSAGKTGTAQDYRDAWFIGFNDSLIVGVWVGNDDHSPMNKVTGGSLPANIWKAFMEQAGTLPVAEAGPSVQPASDSTVKELQEVTGAVDPGAESSFDRLQNGQCNVPVCERRYNSFRASDCTYQPYWGGPRQFCAR